MWRIVSGCHLGDSPLEQLCSCVAAMSYTHSAACGLRVARSEILLHIRFISHGRALTRPLLLRARVARPWQGHSSVGKGSCEPCWSNCNMGLKDHLNHRSHSAIENRNEKRKLTLIRTYPGSTNQTKMDPT